MDDEESEATRGDALGDRMKDYESAPRARLTPKVPVLIRLDGKAFHTFTRGLERPYCRPFHECMWAAAKYLCERVQGCRLAYVQSDEITLLLADWDGPKTQGWFDYGLQKMVSVAASMCSVAFWEKYREFATGTPQLLPWNVGLPAFDARAWNVPRHEVVNAFVWRQQDATRNAIQLLGQAHFSHKQLHGKSCSQIQEMLFSEKGVNFNDCPVPQKRGACVVKETYFVDGPPGVRAVQRTRWAVDENIPIFTQDRAYVESRMPEEAMSP